MNAIYLEMNEQLDKELLSLPTDCDNIFFSIEKAIGLCTLVLYEMKELVSENEFSDKMSEIHFFKHVKPKVYSKLIFYLKLLKIETHKPSFPRENQIQYLVSILKDLQNMYKDNADFYQYYRLNQTYLDDKYFLRDSGYLHFNCNHTHYLLDPKFSTAQDYTIALFLAHESLIKYLGVEIEKLNIINKPDFYSKIQNLSSFNFKWTESKVAMVELIYALHSSQSINNGRVEIKEIARLFEIVFDIHLGDIYRIFLELRSRKIEQTKYMDYLKDSLIRRMDEADEK